MREKLMTMAKGRRQNDTRKKKLQFSPLPHRLLGATSAEFTSRVGGVGRYAAGGRSARENTRRLQSGADWLSQARCSAGAVYRDRDRIQEGHSRPQFAASVSYTHLDVYKRQS